MGRAGGSATSGLAQLSPGDLPGELLAGRYRIAELLGRGGMAEVRAAHDERLDREVAVKILRPELAADPAVRQRFEAEARTAARLSHPSVVNVFDAGSDGERVFLVMERLTGTTLEDEMESGPMSVGRVVDIGRQVASALAVAHRAGIIHRDIKPGNVLTGPDGSIKVADFGIATVMGAASVTATGLVVGTPAYLAPERAAGESASVRSDVYSVGALLYACLAGRRPYEADSAVALMVVLQSRAPTPIDELRPDVPAGVSAVIEKAMARRPEDRFAGAAELADALAALPISGAAATSASRAAGVAADPTAVMAAAGLASSAGIGAGSTPVTGVAAGAGGGALAPPGEGPGWRRASIVLVSLALLILVAGLVYGLTRGIGSNPGPAGTTTTSAASTSSSAPTSSTSSTTSSSSTSTTTTSTTSTTSTSTTVATTTVTVTVPGASSTSGPSNPPTTTAATSG